MFTVVSHTGTDISETGWTGGRSGARGIERGKKKFDDERLGEAKEPL